MRCFPGVAAGCVGTYIAMDVQRWRAQEKRQARQQEIRNALWLRKAEMLEHFHDFSADLQKQGALQAVTDSGKLVLAVIPGAAVFGDAADAIDNANNLHDLYQLLCQFKDISDLEDDEESKLIQVLSRSELGMHVLQSKLEIAGLEAELSTLGSADWSGHHELSAEWLWWMPSTYWRWLLSTAWPEQGAQEPDKYVKVFYLMDKDKDGCINKAEFKRALQRLEAIDDHWKELAKGDARAFFLKADADGDGKINAEDFALWVRTTSELVAYFKALDNNGDGLIDVTEFKEVLRQVTEKMQRMKELEAEIKELASKDVDAEFHEIDSNKDGQINLPEFVGWMQGSTALGFYSVISRFTSTSRARAFILASESRSRASSLMEWSAASAPAMPMVSAPSLPATWHPTVWLPPMPTMRSPWRRPAPAAEAKPEDVAEDSLHTSASTTETRPEAVAQEEPQRRE